MSSFSTCSCDCSCISSSDCSVSHPSFVAQQLYQFNRFAEIPPLLFLPQPSNQENKSTVLEEAPTNLIATSFVKPAELFDQEKFTHTFPTSHVPSLQSVGIQAQVVSVNTAIQCSNDILTSSIGVATDALSTRTSSSNTCLLVASGATQTPWQDWELLWQHRFAALYEAEHTMRCVTETTSVEFFDRLRSQLDDEICCSTRVQKLQLRFADYSAILLLLQLTSLMDMERQQRDALEHSQRDFFSILANWKSEFVQFAREKERYNCESIQLASEVQQQKSLIAAQSLELNASNAMMCLFRKRIMEVVTVPTNAVVAHKPPSLILTSTDDQNWMSVSVHERFAQATSKARQLLERNEK